MKQIGLNQMAKNNKKRGDDDFNQMVNISGIIGICEGINHNGMIKGCMNSAFSSKSQKFEFRPCQTRVTAIDWKAEIRRLYFDMLPGKASNKTSMKLVQKDTIEETERTQCFLMLVPGCFMKRVNVEIYFYRLNMQMVVKLKVKDQIVSLNVWVHLQRYMIDRARHGLGGIAKWAQNNLMVIESSLNEYNLCEIREAREKF